jgi:hypothetical protein
MFTISSTLAKWRITSWLDMDVSEYEALKIKCQRDATYISDMANDTYIRTNDY